MKYFTKSSERVSAFWPPAILVSLHSRVKSNYQHPKQRKSMSEMGTASGTFPSTEREKSNKALQLSNKLDGLDFTGIDFPTLVSQIDK